MHRRCLKDRKVYWWRRSLACNTVSNYLWIRLEPPDDFGRDLPRRLVGWGQAAESWTALHLAQLREVQRTLHLAVHVSRLQAMLFSHVKELQREPALMKPYKGFLHNTKHVLRIVKDLEHT